MTQHYKLTDPVITIEQRIAIAIRCALTVCNDSLFTVWANNWLNNTDRTEKSAWAVAEAVGTVKAAYYAAKAAAWLAEAAEAAAIAVSAVSRMAVAGK